jgi:hypothetical protein
MSASEGASGMEIEPGELPFDCSDSFIATVIPPCSRRISPATQYIAGIGERRRRDNRRRFPSQIGGTVTGNGHATERKSAKGILRHWSSDAAETARDVPEVLPGGDRAATLYHYRSPRAYHRFCITIACPGVSRVRSLPGLQLHWPNTTGNPRHVAPAVLSDQARDRGTRNDPALWLMRHNVTE